MTKKLLRKIVISSLVIAGFLFMLGSAVIGLTQMTYAAFHGDTSAQGCLAFMGIGLFFFWLFEDMEDDE